MSLFTRNPDPIGPLDYSRRFTLRFVVALTLFFLYAPILGLIVFSFNDSRRNIVWRGFTTKYYEKLFSNDALMLAFGNSLTIAVLTTIFATVLGALAAYVLWRYRFPGKAIYEGGMALPIVIPEICMGVAMMVFFARIGWPSGMPWPLNLSSITIAHIAFSFRDVVVPHMKPGLIAGALLAFTLSLDDFVITFFTSGPDTVTFPVKIYSMVRFSVTPEVNAASTVLILLTLAVTAFALRLQNRNNMLSGGH